MALYNVDETVGSLIANNLNKPLPKKIEGRKLDLTFQTEIEEKDAKGIDYVID